jgi:hypothetical protein
MNEPRRFSLIKPSIDTPFHIDVEWWKYNDRNWRVFLHDYMCPEHQALFDNLEDANWVDWIDPETAEVKRVDGLQHVLMSHCARQPNFITANTTMVDAIFRVFLSNGNEPLTVRELSEIIMRPAETILRTISGPQVYKGLRPVKI